MTKIESHKLRRTINSLEGQLNNVASASPGPSQGRAGELDLWPDVESLRCVRGTHIPEYFNITYTTPHVGVGRRFAKVRKPNPY